MSNNILSADLRAGQRLFDSARQVRAAAEETQAEIDGLTSLVISLAKHASILSRRLDEQPEHALPPGQLDAMRREVSSLDAAANKTIARLQFAERLQHRLMNVQLNLDALSRWFESLCDEQSAGRKEKDPKVSTKVSYLNAMPRRKRDLH